ncbi:MAG: CHASE2 domain-containing protein, partial [Magnetococcales bacterium]|nr:CHASE2 domain-containing protein [Magnetococcales bacterium]
MKFTDWKNSWLVGGILLLAFLFMDQHPLIQNMERALYDWGVRVASYTPLQDRIVIVAVDDESISRLGRWPWSRNLHAKAIDLLSKGRPKQIINTLFYLEPQTDPGQTHLINLKNFLDTSRLKKSLEEQKAMLTFPSLVMDMQTMTTMLDNALADLDADKHLATSIRHAGNVLLGMPFTLGRPLGRPSEDLPPYLLKNFIAHTKGGDNQTLLAKSASPPLEILGTEASGIGHLLTPLDSDGGVRTLPLAIDYYGAYFPSLALLSAAHSLGIDSRGVILRPGAGIQLGRLWIQTDPRLRMFPFYYSDGIQPAFQVDSIHDVLSGRILPQKYRDKIVLLGVTATGVTTRHPTPLSPTTTPVEILAHTISSILDEV